MNLPGLLRQFKQYCLIERGMTAKNHQSIIRNMKSLAEFAQTENVKKLDEGMIREFLMENSRKRGWSPKTFRTYLQNLSCFFGWCEKKGYITKNPTLRIEKPKLPKRLPRCLTKYQASTILNNASFYHWRYDIEKYRNEAIIYTFLFTGIRLQELLLLQMSDVNLEYGEITIIQGKGRKDRIVPIHPRLTIVFRRYLKERKRVGKCSKWFFTGIHSNKRLYEKNVREICSKISKQSGIKFSPHVLRHTFARLSIDANLNLFKLKEILGHSEVSTTQIYLSVSTESMKKSFNNLQLI
ncbi:MAG: tyrosine-type recombinase/integrase [Bacteroidales bacterium]